MSGITLADAQLILDNLIQAQKDDPAGVLGSVTVNGRSVTYKDSSDLIGQVRFWSGEVARLTRRAAGGPRHAFAVADFRGCR